ncbi:MAG: hypothetical protein ACRD6N_12120, partial [Pyrinomonadaceae bacterium]
MCALRRLLELFEQFAQLKVFGLSRGKVAFRLISRLNGRNNFGRPMSIEVFVYVTHASRECSCVARER